MDNYKYEKMNISEIEETVAKCTICILCMCNRNLPYCVPVYFDYDKSKHQFLIESKNNGRKINIITDNENAVIYLQYDQSDCYKTIIAEGRIKIENTTSDIKNMISIIFTSYEISGRVFKK